MTADAIAKPGSTPSSLLMLRPTDAELEDARAAINKADSVLFRHFTNEQFYLARGSRIWPSNNPEDSPFDAFICRYCGWKFEQRMNGNFSLYLNVTPIANAVRRMQTHLRGCKVYKRRTPHANP